MKRMVVIFVLMLGMMGAAPVHGTSEAPDTRPVTGEQLAVRWRIYTALRIGGALTTVGLLVLIGVLVRRDLKRGGTL